MTFNPTVTSDRRLLLVVLFGGIALRLIWFGTVHGLTDFAGLGEATRVAVALAEGRGFADTYYAGQGPSAHLLPVMPAIAGGVMALLGRSSAAANMALLCWALAQTLCAWLLLRALFARLDVSPTTQRWGLILLCLVPVFAPHETVDFRWWEGAASVCLLCVNLILLLDTAERRRLAPRALIAIAGLTAATFIVSPPVGLAAGACWAVQAWRSLPARQTVLLGATAAVALAAMVAPWAIRNERVLGEPVLLRSNFGLELALANHPAAIGGSDPERVFAERLAAIHPYHGQAAQAAVRSEGEIGYMSRLDREARAWIAGHPIAFATLYMRHLTQFFFPRPWQMSFTAATGDYRVARSLIISAVNLAGLIALAIGLWRRRRGYWLLALSIAAIAAPYGLVQPIPRYTYLVYGLLAFLAVDLIVSRSGRR